MSNEELLNEIDERFKRHMGVLLEEHRKEIKIVGEGHSTLIRKINELDAKVGEGQKAAEKRLDRLTREVSGIKDELKENYGKRLKRVEEKVSI